MRRLALLVVLAFVWASAAAAPARAETLEETFQRGADAYRRGAYEEADVVWRTLLDQSLSDAALARVAYDLGNTAYRRGERMAAIGWYTACTRLAPRDADAWANLELVRSQAGLPPADRGDLRSTAERLVSSVRPAEARLLVLAGLGVLVVVLALEALLGGGALRRLGLGVALLVALAAVPWGRALLAPAEPPLLVTSTSSVALRSEPRASLAPIGQLAPGDEVEKLDELPGWVRVVGKGGTRGWVPDEAVFALPR